MKRIFVICMTEDRSPAGCTAFPHRLAASRISAQNPASRKATSYPTVNLDNVNDRLFALSKELLEEIRSDRLKMHMSLVPVSAALMTDYDKEYFGIE